MPSHLSLFPLHTHKLPESLFPYVSSHKVLAPPISVQQKTKQNMLIPMMGLKFDPFHGVELGEKHVVMTKIIPKSQKNTTTKNILRGLLK